MMAQVWDLNVTECRSALEAALLEADEIKKWNPPYNVAMKKGKRHLLFYDRDFTSCAKEQNARHRSAPFAISTGLSMCAPFRLSSTPRFFGSRWI